MGYKLYFLFLILGWRFIRGHWKGEEGHFKYTGCDHRHFGPSPRHDHRLWCHHADGHSFRHDRGVWQQQGQPHSLFIYLYIYIHPHHGHEKYMHVIRWISCSMEWCFHELVDVSFWVTCAGFPLRLDSTVFRQIRRRTATSLTVCV